MPVRGNKPGSKTTVRKVAVITDELGYETCDTTSGICVHHAMPRHLISEVTSSQKGNKNVNVANVLYCLPLLQEDDLWLQGKVKGWQQ